MDLLPENLPVFLIGADYSGHKKSIRLIFYDQESEKLFEWFGSDHEPYCLTDVSPDKLVKIGLVARHPSFKRTELITKYDALNDCDISVTKVIAKDPRAIGGGKPTENLRDLIPQFSEGSKVWEAKIDYGSCYIYDNQLEMGMPYQLHDNELVQCVIPEAEDRIDNIANKIGMKEERWIRLCEYPVPDFRRCAIDIEVLGEKYSIPNQRKAEYPVVSVCIVGSDGKRKVFMLLRDGIDVGDDIVDGSIEFFNSEKELILALFTEMLTYPIIITFNGDNFDMTYLYNRSLKLGILKEKIPLIPHRQMIEIKNHIHLDLYRLFFHNSLKNYAFQGKYKSTTLDAISMALLGEGKIKFGEEWMDMKTLTYTQLARYNIKDGDLTMKLTTYDDGLVMKLIVALMRISAMPMEDLNRYPISSWIRGMIFNEHRRRGVLIPNREDILEFPNKGTTTTKAVIKGKKFKGAIVVEPIAGVHFNVAVMDFASLYPSILKTRNLGYSTINCSHPKCKSNTIPETNHWVCTKNKAIEGELIGLLKDLRVRWYKKKKKESSWYSVVEQAIKVFCNASYGVFGDDSFALYCPPVAESTTAVGRHSIMETINKARELGIEVLYGDTDSLFLKDVTEEQKKLMIEWSTKFLDLDLEVDKEYRYVCLSSRKKNYLGVTPEGDVDVKGMTGKKRHVPMIVKGGFNITKKYLSEAKSLDEVLVCKKALKQVVQNIYYKIKRRDFDLNEMAFTMTLGKNISAYEKSTPQHVRAAQILKKEIGIKMKKGDSVSFVKCIPFDWMPEDGNEMIRVNVRPLQLAKKTHINTKKYHEILKSTFEQILDCLGVEYDSVIGITKLERFF